MPNNMMFFGYTLLSPFLKYGLQMNCIK